MNLNVSELIQTRAAVTPEELATITGKHTMTVRRWCKSGEVKCNRVGRSDMIPISEVKRLTGIN